MHMLCPNWAHSRPTACDNRRQTGCCRVKAEIRNVVFDSFIRRTLFAGTVCKQPAFVGTEPRISIVVPHRARIMTARGRVLGQLR
jgi:hypothetical protein